MRLVKSYSFGRVKHDQGTKMIKEKKLCPMKKLYQFFAQSVLIPVVLCVRCGERQCEQTAQ